MVSNHEENLDIRTFSDRRIGRPPEDLEEPEAPEGRGREHLVVGAGEDDGGGAYCYYIWKNGGGAK